MKQFFKVLFESNMAASQGFSPSNSPYKVISHDESPGTQTWDNHFRLWPSLLLERELFFYIPFLIKSTFFFILLHSGQLFLFVSTFFQLP